MDSAIPNKDIQKIIGEYCQASRSHQIFLANLRICAIQRKIRRIVKRMYLRILTAELMVFAA